MSKLYIDPPSGWRYGFPKELPDDYFNYTPERKTQWLIEQGYPKKLVDEMISCRIFAAEKD